MSELTDYDLRHCVTHLLEAHASEQLHQLLTATDASGGNLWFELKEARGHNANYTADLREALAFAKAQWLMEPSATVATEALNRLLQYALMLSTLNSFASRIPSALLRGLVRTGAWPWPTALDYARRVPHPVERIHALAAIFPNLPAAARNEPNDGMWGALDELKSLAGNSDAWTDMRRESVMAMARAFSKAEDGDRLINLAEACRSWPQEDGWIRTTIDVLREALPWKPEECLDRATQIPPIGPDDRARLLPLLDPGLKLLFAQRLSQEVRCLERGWSTAPILQAIEPYLEPNIFAETVEAVFARLPLPSHPVYELVAFLPMVSPQIRNEIAAELARKWSGGTADFDVQDLIAPIARMEANSRADVIRVLEGIEWPYTRWLLQSLLIRFDSGEEQQRKADAIESHVIASRRRSDSFSADELLSYYATSAEYLAPSCREALLRLVQGMTYPDLQLKAIASVIPALPPADQCQVVMDSLAKVLAVQDEKPKIAERFLGIAGDVLPAAQLREVVKGLRRTRDEPWRIRGLSRLLSRLSPPDWAVPINRALGTIVQLDGWERNEMLLSLKDWIGEEQRRRIPAMIVPTPDMASAVKTAAEFCTSTRSLSIRKGLQKIADMDQARIKISEEEIEARVHLLNAFPERRGSPQVDDCFSALGAVRHLTTRAKIVLCFGPWCADRVQGVVADLVESAFWDVDSAASRDALRTLAPALPYALARSTARRLLADSEEHLTSHEALPSLLARIAELGHLRASLALTQRLNRPLKEQLNGEALTEIAPYLGAKQVERLIPLFVEIANDYTRDHALAALCLRAASLGLTAMVAPQAMRIQREELRSESCAALVAGAEPELQATLLDAAIDGLKRLNGRMRVWPLPLVADALVHGCPDSRDFKTRLADLVEFLSQESRAELVPQLYALSEAFHKANGAAALLRLNESIHQVSGWWP